VRRAAHRDVGEQQMVVDDDDVRVGRDAPRPEDEAFLKMLALEALAQIGLGGNFVPDLAAWLRGEIGERAVLGLRGPAGELRYFVARVAVEERRLRRFGLLEPRETEVVVPSLEQREAHRLIVE